MRTLKEQSTDRSVKYFAREKKGIVTYYDTDKKQFMKTSIQDLREKQKKCDPADIPLCITVLVDNSYITDVKGLWLFYDDKHMWTGNDKYPLASYVAKALGYGYPYNQLNHHFFTYACTKINPGDTLTDFMAYYDEAPEFYKQRREERAKKNELRYPKVNGDALSYIMAFKGIQIERSSDNRKQNTFDFIRVTYSLPSSMPKEELIANIKRDYKAIANHAVMQLQESNRYTRFGVPVNFLKVTKCIITNDRLLQLTFELKERELCMTGENEPEKEELELDERD